MLQKLEVQATALGPRAVALNLEPHAVPWRACLNSELVISVSNSLVPGRHSIIAFLISVSQEMLMPLVPRPH